MFKYRSYRKELLDEPDIAKELLYQNLKELEVINKNLGGHSVSLKGLKIVVKDKIKSHRVIDIGCGGGDSIKAIANWGNKNGFHLQLTGVDLKQDCIDYSGINCLGLPGIQLRCEDFRQLFIDNESFDIIHASLFFHHFREDEIISFFELCNRYNIIAVINDLERNPIAYYSIKFLTGIFSKSPLVKNDAPLSVLRGFKKVEWRSMLQKAGVKSFSVKNCWAFRHLVIAYPNGN